MLLRILVASLFLAPITSSQGAGPRLELEGLDGTLREAAPGPLATADPRDDGVWLVRPRDFGGRAALLAARGGGEAVRVELSSGDALRGRIAGGAGETLAVELIGGVTLDVAIDRIRRVDFPERIPRGRPIALEAPREGDRLYRWTGREVDPIGGAVEEFTPEGVRFDSDTVGRKLYPWDEIAALFVEVLGEPDPADGGDAVPVVLDLVDESRLAGTLVRLEAAGARLSVAGAEVLFPWAAVHELLVDDGALRYLSEVPADREEGRGSPFGDELGMVWEHRVDRCVTGSELVVGGRVFRRGIGTHAPTRVTWRLTPELAGGRKLRGRVGVDDSSLLHPPDARGSVVFRVFLDGRVVWESRVLRGGDAPQVLPGIALDGHTELTLEADMVGDFRGDRADWLRMRLVAER